MSDLRLRLVLHKGRQGVPIERLVRVASEADAFCRMFAADLGLEKGRWIAENFSNESVAFDSSYLGVANTETVVIGEKALRQLVDPTTTPDTLEYGVRRETFHQFAKIAAPLELGDYVEVGIYNGIAAPDFARLTRERYDEIDGLMARPVVRFIEVRGYTSAVVYGASVLSLRVTDVLTGQTVSCRFPHDKYAEIYRLMDIERRLVSVEGWATYKRNTLDHFDAERIAPLPDYHEGDLERLLGADPEFTGGLSPREYLEKLHGDDDDL